MMNENYANNRQIAKNTLLLYFRMLLLMVVNLYTSRVTLAALGVEDYGIYNVVGGVVAIFSVLSGSLIATVSRFITFELGHNDKEHLKTVFSTSMNIQIALSFIVMVIAEIGGVWFLNCKMNIDTERLVAANWVWQCSVVTFMVSFISVPYNAAIIAHEKMEAFAYISLIEAVLKLLIAYFLYVTLYDKLIIYALLLCLTAVVLRLVYGVYCKLHFEECTYHFIYDKNVLKSMTSFAGWNFIEAAAHVLESQMISIWINIFCDVTVNAARAISSQVFNAVNNFADNFLTAINPQITKNYASGNNGYMTQLMFQGARFSYYVLLLLSIPIILETQTILSIWLGNVPKHSSLFVQLMLLFSMEEVLSKPLITALLATGDIKMYQISVSCSRIANIAVSYFLLKIGMFPEITIVIAILIGQCCLAVRLLLMQRIARLSLATFLYKVYINVIVVSFVAVSVPMLLHYIIQDRMFRLVIVILGSLLWTMLSICVIGCKKEERALLLKKTNNILNKIKA